MEESLDDHRHRFWSYASHGWVGLVVVILVAVAVLAGLGGYVLGTRRTVARPAVSEPKGQQSFLQIHNQSLNPTTSSLPVSNVIPLPTANLNPTAGWHEYTNATYGYAFRYPSNWNMDQDTQRSPAQPNTPFSSNLQILAIASPQGPALGTFTIHIFNNPNNLTLRQWITNQQAVSQTLPSRENYAVDHKAAFKVQEPGGQAPPATSIWVDDGALIFLLTMTGVQNNDIYSRILNSFVLD